MWHQLLDSNSLCVEFLLGMGSCFPIVKDSNIVVSFVIQIFKDEIWANSTLFCFRYALLVICNFQADNFIFFIDSIYCI